MKFKYMFVSILVNRLTSGTPWLSLWVPGWLWFLCSPGVPFVISWDHSPSWRHPAWPLSSVCPLWPLLLGLRQSASAGQPEDKIWTAVQFYLIGGVSRPVSWFWCKGSGWQWSGWSSSYTAPPGRRAGSHPRWRAWRKWTGRCCDFFHRQSLGLVTLKIINPAQ